MSSEIMPYVSVIVVSTVLNLFVFMYAYIKRHTYSNIVNLFLIHMLGLVIYCFTNVMWLMSTSLESVHFWTTMMYIGIGFSPPLGLLFVLRYFGVELSKKLTAALMVIPTITFFMVATNDWHHLHYRIFIIDPVLGAPFVYQIEGLWYIVQGTYGFVCMFAASVFTIYRWRETSKKYRPQLLTLLCGQAIPITVSFFYLVDFVPRGVDPVPMVLWATSLMYLWAIKSSGLFTTMPIAKKMIFNNMNDGLVVLNSSNNLVEYNKAFQRMFPGLTNADIGKNFMTLWRTLTDEEFPYELSCTEMTTEIVIGKRDQQKIYQLRITPMQYVTKGKEQIVLFTDITELKLLQRKLEQQAFYDDLSGIFNRRAFFQQSEPLYIGAIESNKPYAIILLDIDHFKMINDTYGHQIGDEVIVHIVNTCKTVLPDDAIFARYGGEEFVIALHNVTKAQVLEIADTLCTTVKQHPFSNEDDIITVTTSIGIAIVNPNHSGTLQQLINKADQALYVAKSSGRNRLAFFEEVTGNTL